MQNNVHMYVNKSNLLNKRNIAGGFLALHGAMHAMLLSTPRPDGGAGNFVTRAGEAPLLNSLGVTGAGVEAIGAALLIASAVGFLIGALLLVKNSSRWPAILAVSSALSLITMALFWNDWMVAGPVIDLAVLGLVVVHRRNPAMLEG